MVLNGEITVRALSSFTMYTGYSESSALDISSFHSELMKGAAS